MKPVTNTAKRIGGITMLSTLILLLISCVLCCNLRADLIFLTNGDQLTGTITQSDREWFRMRTQFLGDVKIQWTAIEEITAEQILYVTAAGGQVLVGPISLAGKTLKVQTTPLSTVAISKAEVDSIRSEEDQAKYEAEIERSHNPGLWDSWSGSIDSGLDATRGNARTTTFSTSMNVQRETEKDKISIYTTSIFAQDGSNNVSETTANAVRGGSRYDVTLSTHLFTFGFIDLEFDEFQNLDLRNVLGGGLGWKLKNTDRTTLEILVGTAFNQEFFDIGLIRRTGEMVLHQELSYELFAATSFSQKFALYPNLGETGQYRIQFDSSLATNLARGFAWQVTFSERFLSNPLPSVKKNDILLTTGVRFYFGKGL